MKNEFAYPVAILADADGLMATAGTMVVSGDEIEEWFSDEDDRLFEFMGYLGWSAFYMETGVVIEAEPPRV